MEQINKEAIDLKDSMIQEETKIQRTTCATDKTEQMIVGLKRRQIECGYLTYCSKKRTCQEDQVISTNNHSENTGRWTNEEHNKFLEGNIIL